jgi:hypothetical protein
MANSTYEGGAIAVWIKKAWPFYSGWSPGGLHAEVVLLPALIRQVVPKSEANCKDKLRSEFKKVLLECLLAN